MAAIESMAGSDLVPVAAIVAFSVIFLMAFMGIMFVTLVVWFAPPLIVFHDVELMGSIKAGLSRFSTKLGFILIGLRHLGSGYSDCRDFYVRACLFCYWTRADGIGLL